MTEKIAVSVFVVVNKILQGYCDRFGYRNYIKSKPEWYGVKIFSICCAAYVIQNLEVYAGSQPDGPFKICIQQVVSSIKWIKWLSLYLGLEEM